MVTTAGRVVGPRESGVVTDGGLRSRLRRRTLLAALRAAVLARRARCGVAACLRTPPPTVKAATRRYAGGCAAP